MLHDHINGTKRVGIVLDVLFSNVLQVLDLSNHKLNMNPIVGKDVPFNQKLLYCLDPEDL